MKKRFIFVPLAIVILLFAVWFFFFRIPVHIVEMSELVVPHYGLLVGPSVLGWSSHENDSAGRNGYIYMMDERPDGGNKPLWEFALTTKRRLSYVRRNDLGGIYIYEKHNHQRSYGSHYSDSRLW